MNRLPAKRSRIVGPALFHLLTWTCILLLLHLLARANLAGRLLHGLLLAALVLLAVLNVIHAWAKFSWMRRRHGSAFRAHCRRARAVLPYLSRSAFEVTKLRSHVAVGCGALLAAVWLHPLSCFVVGAMLVSIAMTIASRLYLPPGVVYLASSSPQRLTLLHQLQTKVILNVTALLDTRNLPAEFAGRLITVPSLFDARTLDDDTWHAVVDELISIAPVVLLDARDTSHGVLQEVERIFGRSLQDKTVFLADENGRLPALEYRSIARRFPGELAVCTEAMLLQKPFGILLQQEEYVMGAALNPQHQP